MYSREESQFVSCSCVIEQPKLDSYQYWTQDQTEASGPSGQDL
jgi:hypothetical protein